MGPYSSLLSAGLCICWGGNSATRASAFFKHLFLSTADKLDISVSGIHLGNRMQPVCLQCKIRIMDHETFGPLASLWLCPHTRLNKTGFVPETQFGTVLSGFPPLWPLWERSKQLRWGLASNTANSFYSKYTKVLFVESSETFESLILVKFTTLDKNGAARKKIWVICYSQ